ncbi:MAG: ATP-binding protein, partial [Dehalococcoidia bacterium]
MNCRHCGFACSAEMRFCGGCGTRLNPIGSEPAAELSDPRTPTTTLQRVLASAEPERRQLTVLFSDLAGWTELSERLDPEELQEVAVAYQEACAGPIEQHEGHIAQYLGDGILVYFGYPSAQEDAAQRALRAALAIVEAVKRLNAGLANVELAVRVGVHSGIVVVADVGGGQRHEHLAVGETPNIAARMQALAGSNEIMISGETLRLVRGYFNCDSLGPQRLKGISRAIELYRVRGETEVDNRLDAGRRLVPLLGRNDELQQLAEIWNRASAGDGQAVLVNGEAGIGKSRLVRALRTDVIGENSLRIELRCSRYHQHSALHPVFISIERALHFDVHDTPELKLEKLDTGFAGQGSADFVPLLAALLSLPHSAAYPPLTYTPELQRRRTLDGLVDWLLRQAGRQPVLMVVEDMHWIDPSTRELLGLILDQLAGTRLLALLTSRSEFSPPSEVAGRCTTLALGRLSSDQVIEMVEVLSEQRRLPAEVLARIVEQADGVPLFVEELTQMVLESGMVRKVGEHYALASPLAQLSIPSTLQDLVMARVDRLTTAREVAQFGAAIGHEFAFDLLQAASRIEEASLRHELSRLVDAGLVQVRGVTPFEH